MTLRAGMEHVLVALVVVFLAAFLTGRLAMRSDIASVKPHSGLIPSVSEEYGSLTYRALVPQLSLALARVVPADIQAQINQAFFMQLVKNKLTKKWYGRAKLKVYKNIRQAHDRFVVNAALLISFVFFCAYAAMIWKLVAHYYASPRMAMISPVIALLFLLPSIGAQTTFNDPPILFFSALLLYCMRLRYLVWFVVVFAVACVNSPLTLIFLPLFLVSFSSCLPRQKLWLIALYMIIVWCLTIAGNISYILSASGNEGRSVLGGELWFMKQRIPILLMLWLLIDYFWDDMDRLIKGMLLLIPLVALCYCLFGISKEYGYFYAVFPTLVLAVMRVLYSVFEPHHEQGVLC